jgi:hypothetical protein
MIKCQDTNSRSCDCFLLFLKGKITYIKGKEEKQRRSKQRKIINVMTWCMLWHDHYETIYVMTRSLWDDVCYDTIIMRRYMLWHDHYETMYVMTRSLRDDVCYDTIITRRCMLWHDHYETMYVMTRSLWDDICYDTIIMRRCTLYKH